MVILYFENIKIINYFDASKDSSDFFLVGVLSQIKHRTLHKNIDLYWKNEQYFWNTIQQYTQFIEAAGGIVCNDKKEMLFIYRNGYWDLPKGKREPNEDLLKNAIREIQEETKIQQLVWNKNLDITYHLYFIENSCILKKTYWYVFQSSYTGILKPQREEGIVEVKWIAPKDITTYSEKMFFLIRELVEKYLKKSI